MNNYLSFSFLNCEYHVVDRVSCLAQMAQFGYETLQEPLEIPMIDDFQRN